MGNVFDDLQNVSNLISSGNRVVIENKNPNKYKDLSVAFYEVEGISDLDKKLYSENTVTVLIDTLLSIIGTNWTKLGSRLKQAFLSADDYEKSFINLDVRVRKQAITVTGELNTRIEIVNNNKYFEIKFKTPDGLFVDKETYLIDSTQEGIGVKPAGLDFKRWADIQGKRVEKFKTKDEVSECQYKDLEEVIREFTKAGVDFIVQGNVLLHFIFRGVITDVFRSTKDFDISVLGCNDFNLIKSFYSDNLRVTIEDSNKFKTLVITDLKSSVEKIDVVSLNSEDFTSDDIDYYEINGITFKGSSCTRILKDKLSVAGSSSLFGRAKDFIDLYLIIRYMNFSKQQIFKVAMFVGFNKSFMLEQEKLLSTIAKNDSVYICDNNLSRVYNYVVDFFEDYGMLE